MEMEETANSARKIWFCRLPLSSNVEHKLLNITQHHIAAISMGNKIFCILNCNWTRAKHLKQSLYIA